MAINKNRVFSLGKPSPLYNETSPDWASLLHLGGAPEEEPIEAVSRYQRVVQRREKRRRVDACDALLSLSEVVVAVTLVPHTDHAVFCCCFTHHMHICHARLLLLSFLEVK